MYHGRKVKMLLLMGMLLVITMSLNACIDVATTGVQAIYNHHSIQKNINDQYITIQIYKAIKLDKDQFDDANITIATYHSDVLLVGQVPTARQYKKIEEIAKDISGVKRVYNLLRISYPSSTLKRISDAWITAKVKAKLIASNDLDATQIKVVTENGTVYLMGILQEEEAQLAVQLASETGGVESVVKIFSYVHISSHVPYLPPTLPNASQ
jgi:osmotically-inducible protein OsmY